MTERRLLLATTNQGKVREIKKLLRGLGLRIESLKDYPEYGSFEETGNTFEENSRGKSLFYSQKYPGLVLAEDSGLEVEALGGKPGVYSARFSGPGATDEKNIKRLLSLLVDVPENQRKARFVCVATLSQGGKVLKIFKGKVQGVIIREPRGANGFGYDPVFFYPPLKKTFAQLRASEKNLVSHRGQALRKVRKFLEEYLRKNFIQAARPRKNKSRQKRVNSC
ncbi:MAG: XTP/dITP diphosphatase [Candidatus Aminicenantes bacterium]|nr:XTP/dITP diphosphatase [Candidatus Aminicenantes bacterium]